MEPGRRLDRLTPRQWAQVLSRYREPNHVRSVFELVITAGAFIALWTVMWFALRFGYWLALGLLLYFVYGFKNSRLHGRA